MRPCAFDTCMCRARHRRHGISFHEFPKSEEIRVKWVSVVRSDKRDPHWSPEPHSRVCSLHFSRSQFLSKKVLHARAVPTARYEAPKFLRSYRRPVEPPQSEDTINLEDDIPSELDGPFPVTVEASGSAEEGIGEWPEPELELAAELAAAAGESAAASSEPTVAAPEPAADEHVAPLKEIAQPDH